ncbi:MAG TPA: HAMP domain-containing sensor histidine kinase [Candidatus Limnocylindrales bacterium]
MRGTLVRGALAVTSMIALAFGVPTAFALQRIAEDRAALQAGKVDLTRTWLTMGGIAILLIAGSVIAADRLGVRALHALDAEREVAADLSHRLRTPLAALRLDTDALPPGPVADRMRQAVDALDTEIDAIILDARSSAAVRATETTDLVEVLADRMAFWAVLAEDHGRHWGVRGTEHPIYLKVPRADLIAAVDAVLGNVFEHTPQGTPFRVTLSPGALVVEDGGAGIADTAAALRRGAGHSGLGLDIVARIARGIGGSVTIDRSPELGGARIIMTVTSPR